MKEQFKGSLRSKFVTSLALFLMVSVGHLPEASAKFDVDPRPMAEVSQNGPASNIDVAIVFAHDASGSITPFEYSTLQDALLKALNSHVFPCAMPTGFYKRVALSYGHWSQRHRHRLDVNWKVIDFNDIQPKAPDEPVVFDCPGEKVLKAAAPVTLAEFSAEIAGLSSPLPENPDQGVKNGRRVHKTIGKTSIDDAISYFRSHLEQLDQKLALKKSFIERRIIVLIADGRDTEHEDAFFKFRQENINLNAEIARRRVLAHQNLAEHDGIEIYSLVIPSTLVEDPDQAGNPQSDVDLLNYHKIYVQSGVLGQSQLFTTADSYGEFLQRILNPYMN